MLTQLVVSAAVVAALIGQANSQVCENVYPRLSCGLTHADEASCSSVGGCWDSNADGAKCFAPKIYGYQFKQISSEPGHQTGELSLNAPSGLKFGTDFPTLSMQVTQESKTRTHIKISPKDEKRWEIPENIIARPGGIYSGKDAATETIIKPQNDDDEYDNMEILITRKNGKAPTADVVFAFTKMLVFQDQYLQFVLGIPSKTAATYGFGESTRSQQRTTFNSTYTLWNTDIAASVFDTTLYGSHPFFLQVDEKGQAHGVLFMNSNAMDITTTESATQGSTIGVQSTGGLIDIYVFAGPTPQNVVEQYLEVVGKPAMVPYWALGFHNCRWGYENLQYVQDVVANYSAANIPLETQWTDIDYMDAYKDFTFSPTNFPLKDMQQFVDKLHANDQHYVPIVDPAIYALDANYSTYTNGQKMGVYVKDLHGSNPYLSQVWPGPTYFPDWFATHAQTYWTNEMKEFYEKIKYDGIWIDMNEASNFCNEAGNGQVCETYMPNGVCDGCCVKCTVEDSSNKYDLPPFVPNVYWKSLGGKTIAMSATHGPADNQVVEYNAHNLYGLMESIATHNALLSVNPNKRPFVLSRSTTMSSGKYAAHWTGDNAATWADLKASIITMNNLALFGMSITGADICGFNDATNEELCARWIEVGAFSPFSRDHNAIGQPPQELYRWENVAEAGRKSLSWRYQLLPYLYTLTYNAHATGALLMNGLWVNFPSDPQTLVQDSQYMWSNGLLFTPVLDQGASSVVGYFPQGKWYSLTDDSMIDASQIGQFVELTTALTDTNIHVHGGSIIPMQSAAMTTAAVRASPYRLLVALCPGYQAYGSLFLDDGVSESLTRSTLIHYSVKDNKFVSQVERGNYHVTNALTQIEIKGIQTSAAIKAARKGDRVPVCRAQALTAESEQVTPTSVTFETHGNYESVVFTFDKLNIVSSFELTWSCDMN